MEVEVNHELKKTTQQLEKGPQQLRVGMPLIEVNKILGPPSASMEGSQMSILQMPGKTFMEWDRPEGKYRLVIENGRLAKIYSTPERGEKNYV